MPGPGSLSLCHAVLGDLKRDSDHHQAAREVTRVHYDEAISIAQNLGTRDVLTNVLPRGVSGTRGR